MGGAQRAGYLSLGKVDRRLPHCIGDAGFHQRGVYVLAPAGLECADVGRLNTVGGEQTGGEVRDGHADLGGRHTGVTGNAHQPADPLGHQVEPAAFGVGSSVAEAGDGAVDEPGVDASQFLVSQPQAFHHARPEVLDHGVGIAGQPLEHGLAGLPLKVDDQAALVAVGGQKPRRPVLDEGRSHPPVVIAAVGLLHLDDVRSQVPQHHRAHGPGQDLGEIEHHHAGQGAVGLGTVREPVSHSAFHGCRIKDAPQYTRTL